MTDVVMEAGVTATSTTCPQEGCIRPYPHEGVRHRFAPTKELQAPAPDPVPVSAPEPAPIVRPNVIEKRPFAGPIEDRPINHAISIVDDGLMVAWDHCYRCKTHITQCGCKEGPMEPTYITGWRTKDFPVNKNVVDTVPPARQEVASIEPDDTDTNVAASEGTHYCTECHAGLYLKDTPDGPRAFTVDGDSNFCPDAPLNIHFAQPYGENEPEGLEPLADAQAAREYLAVPEHVFDERGPEPGTTETEHPDVDPEPPVVRATDDPAYDEAAQQEAESTPVQTDIDPEVGF